MAAKNKNSYSNRFKQEMIEIIDRLELSDLQKKFMKSRWLDQLSWLSSKAKHSQKWYHRLRLMTIIGGVVIPAMVSLNLNDERTRTYAIWMTFGLSQVVAISAAVDEFFHYGDRWNQYRKSSELLKSEGWQFFQLTGSYNFPSHSEAYSLFAHRIENLIQSDVQSYVEMSKQKQEESKQAVANTLSNLQQSKLTVTDTRAISQTTTRSTLQESASSSEELDAATAIDNTPASTPTFREPPPIRARQERGGEPTPPGAGMEGDGFSRRRTRPEPQADFSPPDAGMEGDGFSRRRTRPEPQADFSPPDAGMEANGGSRRRTRPEPQADFSPPDAGMEANGGSRRRTRPEPQADFSPPDAGMEANGGSRRRTRPEPQADFSPPGAGMGANGMSANDREDADMEMSLFDGGVEADDEVESNLEDLDMALTQPDVASEADAGFPSDREDFADEMTPPAAAMQPPVIAARKRQDSEASLAASGARVNPHFMRQDNQDYVAGKRRR